MNSRPVRSKQKPVRPRKTTDDFKLVYKSPKYLNKHKAKAKDIDGSFMPKTNHNLDHVSLHFYSGLRVGRTNGYL